LTDSPFVKPILQRQHNIQPQQPGTGTFRASKLEWSAENNELYFKGKVRVDFKKQRFHGNGSFTFLGKVHLLIIDEQQIALGNSIKLSDDDYKLVTLDSEAATEKYGDKGLRGAVEIFRSR
jgi:hypothetical protein